MQTKGTKFEETAIIIRQEEIADDIYSMWLRTEHIAAHAKAGQCVSVYCNEGSRLRPASRGGRSSPASSGKCAAV